MWPFKKNSKEPEIPYWAAAAIVASVISLFAALGVARWSWLILEEQISLRQDFMNLKASQEQLNTQYDFWSAQLQKERAEIQKLKGAR